MYLRHQNETPHVVPLRIVLNAADDPWNGGDNRPKQSLYIKMNDITETQDHRGARRINGDCYYSGDCYSNSGRIAAE